MNNKLTPAHMSAQISLLDMRRDPVNFPRVGAVSTETALPLMAKIVTQALMYKGQTADPGNVKFIASSLLEELVADNDHIGTRCISFAEIHRVVKRAILKDDSIFVSVASLYKIITDYIKGEGHELNKQVGTAPAPDRVKQNMIATMAMQFAQNAKI